MSLGDFYAPKTEVAKINSSWTPFLSSLRILWLGPGCIACPTVGTSIATRTVYSLESSSSAPMKICYFWNTTSWTSFLEICPGRSDPPTLWRLCGQAPYVSSRYVARSILTWSQCSVLNIKATGKAHTFTRSNFESYVLPSGQAYAGTGSVEG